MRCMLRVSTASGQKIDFIYKYKADQVLTDGGYPSRALELALTGLHIGKARGPGKTVRYLPQLGNPATCGVL